MESQMVRRRVNVIAGHLTSRDDISATAAHVFPMRCSNSPNSVIRYDSTTFFARQGAGSQGCFMRQAFSTAQRCSNSPSSVTQRYDNTTFFARQGAGSQGCFMRQASSTEQGNYIQLGTHSKLTSCGDAQLNAHDAPAFARPAQVRPGIPTVKGIQSAVEDCKYTNNAPEAPIFARPSRQCEQPQFKHKESTDNFTSKECGSPKMDIVESGFNYVVTLEIPGISTNNIKVEVDNQSLIVTGNRSNWSCEAACSNKSDSFYHRREILPGPCRVVWHLPSNANKESVSAEIQDGLLQITIPKLSAVVWLRKANM